MDKLITWEHWRFITVSSISPILGYLTPTRGFVIALILMFAFNIWAGMRADGVAIVRCKNFSFKKFKNALCELLLYLFIVELIFTVMNSCGDKSAAIVAVKSLTYVFMYVYLQNAFRNLIVAYPKKLAIRVIYHVIRFEFKRAIPTYIRPIVERLGDEFDNAEKKGNSKVSDNESK